MTKLEIIEDVTSFYNINNRSICKRENRSDACVYEDSNGNKCAVGRYLIDTSDLIITVGTSIRKLIEIRNANNLDELLKKEYRGHSEDFWSALQNFHDFESNFTNEGLSEKGLSEKKFLISLYKNK